MQEKLYRLCAGQEIPRPFGGAVIIQRNPKPRRLLRRRTLGGFFMRLFQKPRVLAGVEGEGMNCAKPVSATPGKSAAVLSSRGISSVAVPRLTESQQQRLKVHRETIIDLDWILFGEGE